MNMFDTSAMREALRRAQEMDTPAMRAALRHADMMDTPAMREAARQAEMMNTPSIREAEKRAGMMNTPAMMEAERRATMMNSSAMIEAEKRAAMMNTPAMMEAERRALMMNSSAMIEAEKRTAIMNTSSMRMAEDRALDMYRIGFKEADRYATIHFRNADVQSVLKAISDQEVWRYSPRDEALRHSFFSSPAFSSVSELIRQSDRALHLTRSPEWEAVSRFDQHHQNLLGRTHHAFSALSEITQFIDHNRQVDVFPGSFADEVLSQLSSLEEPVDNESVGKFLAGMEKLLEIFLAQSRNLAPSSISYDAMINYTLTISLFVYSLYADYKTEQRITDAVERARTEISKEIKGLAHTSTDDVFLVTLQDTDVRSNPDTNEKSTQILSPYQQVRLIQEHDNWLYVEYFDYIQGVPKMGWVLRDHIAQIRY